MVAKRISPTVVTYNALICGLCIMGQLKDAIGLSHKMILENINRTLMDGYCMVKEVNKTKDIFNAMYDS